LNFFGHAAVALWRSPEPRFLLGAMLPDFAGMIRARPPSVLDRQIGAGVDFHHETDRAFHDAPSFRALCSEAFGELLERGVRRGSARAVAHVGIEILLDSVIARREPRAQDAYLFTLEQGREESLGRFVEWRTLAERGRFSSLLSALASRGASAATVSPELVAFRVTRALSGRPRLELDERAELEVRDWAERARERVAEQGPPLLDELRTLLALPRP